MAEYSFFRHQKPIESIQKELPSESTSFATQLEDLLNRSKDEIGKLYKSGKALTDYRPDTIEKYVEAMLKSKDDIERLSVEAADISAHQETLHRK